MRKWSTFGVLVAAALWAIGVGAAQLMKYQAFGYNGLDLGIYTQAVWGLSRGAGFLSSIHDPSYLGDHFEPILFLLAATYRIFESPLTLLWAQTIALAISVWPLTLLVRNMLGHRWAPWVAIAWLLNPLLLNAALYEFHALTLALPILLWSIVAYRSGRRWTWLIALVAICAVREDMPLVAAGWAAYAALDRRSWRWWAPAAALAVAWFLVAQNLIAAANPSGTYKYLAFYARYGSSFAEILTYPFRHPILFLGNVFGPNNLQTVAGFFLVFGFLPILRLRRLVPVGILAVQLLVNAASPYSVLRLHYVIPYLPFLLWASLAVLRDVREGRLFPKLDRAIVAPLVAILFAIGPVYALSVYGPLERPWPLPVLSGATRPEILREALAYVRPDDRVVTTFRFLPHVADREALYSLNYVYLGRRQYSETPYQIPTGVDVALIDWQQMYDYQFLYRDTLFEGRTGAQRIRDLLEESGMGVEYERDAVTVYSRRGSSNDALPQRIEPTGTAAAYGPVLIHGIPSVSVDAGAPATVRIRLAAGVASPQTEPVTVRVTLRGETPVTWYRLLGPKTSPMVDWQPGEAWQHEYVLEVPDGAAARGDVTLDLLTLTGRYRFDRVRSFVPHVTEETLLGSLPLGSIAAGTR